MPSEASLEVRLYLPPEVNVVPNVQSDLSDGFVEVTASEADLLLPTGQWRHLLLQVLSVDSARTQLSACSEWPQFLIPAGGYYLYRDLRPADARIRLADYPRLDTCEAYLEPGPQDIRVLLVTAPARTVFVLPDDDLFRFAPRESPGMLVHRAPDGTPTMIEFPADAVPVDGRLWRVWGSRLPPGSIQVVASNTVRVLGIEVPWPPPEPPDEEDAPVPDGTPTDAAPPSSDSAAAPTAGDSSASRPAEPGGCPR